jgi:hypothetical protein
VAQPGPKWSGRSCLLCPGNSDINLFCYGKGIIDLDAVARSAVNRHWRTYSASISARTSYPHSPRPLTCQIPVMPGRA